MYDIFYSFLNLLSDPLDFLDFVILVFVLTPVVGVAFYLFLVTKAFRSKLLVNTETKLPRYIFYFVVLLPILALVMSAIQESFGKWMATPCYFDFRGQIYWKSLAGIILGYISVAMLLSPFVLLILVELLGYLARRRERKNDQKVYRLLFYFVLLYIVVLALWGTATYASRDKGPDAVIKGTLLGLRVQHELYFDEQGHYPIVTGNSNVERWAAMFQELYPNLAVWKSPCYQKTSDARYQPDYRNSQNGTEWVTVAILRDGTYWCVDYTGVSRRVKAPPDKSIFLCP